MNTGTSQRLRTLTSGCLRRFGNTIGNTAEPQPARVGDEPRRPANRASPSLDRGGGRRWHALWRDAEGRHQRILGPAWVKDSGKRTRRGAPVWRAANGPKPDPSYLTRAEAADQLQTTLAAAPRRTTRGRRHSGPTFAAVAAEWLEHGERKRGLNARRYVVNGHLLPVFGQLELRAITRQHIEQWHTRYERTRTAGKVVMVLGASLRTPSAANSSPQAPSTESSATPSATPATTISTAARRSTPSSATRPRTRTPSYTSPRR
jgi:hypothetical protein